MSIYTSTGPVFYSSVPAQARAISHAAFVVTSNPAFTKRHEGPVKLQEAALKAFREAERVYGRNTIDQKLPRPLRRSRAIRITGIGWRDYDVQEDLWRDEPLRFAPPWKSGHVQGLAIDVDTNQPELRGEIARALRAVGWVQSRPDDEPWHWSWGVEV